MRKTQRPTRFEKNQWPKSPIGIGGTLQSACQPLASSRSDILHIEKSLCRFRLPLVRWRPTDCGRLMKPKRTILCVDDNEQSLSHRKIMLETRGYRVASFSRGEEALARFMQGGVDLVIADMAMPGLDGPQLIAKIKDLSPRTPAILISSKVRIYDHDSQADVFLTKGMYAPVDLLERVRLLLVRKRGPKRLQQRPPQISNQIGAA
jgi:two-component system response regulator CpxR